MSEIERRPAGEITARDVLAAAIDTMAIHGVPVTSRAKGMIARQAKELLGDGFSPDTVLAASVIAIRRGEPQSVHFIAQDIALTQSGQRLSRKDYEGELRAASDRLHPQKAGARKRLLDMLGVDEGVHGGTV